MAATAFRASPFTTSYTAPPDRKSNSRSQRRFRTVSLTRPPALILSTDPSHIDIHQLKNLYTACNLSCHRFPIFNHEGFTEPVDLEKLRIAVSNSFVVVSVFARRLPLRGSLIERMVPLTYLNGELVGFGRAVSDSSLTASIHDVMVIPSLRRMGIGRMILKRLIRVLSRVLTSKDIYDIAALCDKNETLFFGACGFGNDMLNSTTMMYTKSCHNPSNDQVITKAGRKQLVL